MLERKTGEFRKARSLLDAYIIRAQGESDSGALQELHEILEREEQLHTVYAERNGSSNKQSTHPSAAAKGSDSSSRGASGKTFASPAKPPQPPHKHTPLVFKCATEEWAYEKKRLSKEEQERMLCMDKIMEFIGLEQVLVFSASMSCGCTEYCLIVLFCLLCRLNVRC